MPNTCLRTDPIPRMMESEDGTFRAFAGHHLLDRRTDLCEAALRSKEVRKVLRAQRDDGSWRSSGKGGEDRHNTLVRTFKSFRALVHRYELDRTVPQVDRAAEVLLSFQTEEGDIRGMIGGQYATYYTGEILSLLIRAGYAEDRRIDDGLLWLLRMRQDDGGWTIPVLTRELKWDEIVRLTGGDSEPLQPDRSRPFSHNWTDMVLRAFAAHPFYKRNRDVRRAAELLKGSLFRPDNYSSYRDPRYWTRFVGWWPNLLTALETLTAMGYDARDPDIYRGVTWFIENQAGDGLWDLGPGRPGSPLEREWLALRICRMLTAQGIR